MDENQKLGIFVLLSLYKIMKINYRSMLDKHKE